MRLKGVTMTQATEEQYAELVGYTGYRDCLEIRRCASAKQVWDYAVDYGVGLGLGRLGYWVGTDREHVFIGREKSDVEVHADGNLDGCPVRWIDA